MTKAELLEKAIKDYPIGTKFYSIANPDRIIVAAHTPLFSRSKRYIGTTDNGYNGVVYCEGKWAKIISKPEQEFTLPEYWHIKVDKDNRKILEKWRTSGGLGGANDGYCLSQGHFDQEFGIDNVKGFWTKEKPNSDSTEITTEQFIKYILKKEQVMGSTFKVTRSQLQRIYDIACPTWRLRIKKLAENAISVFSDECVITFEQVKGMMDACTEEQLPTLQDIFPSYNEDKNVEINEENIHKLIGVGGALDIRRGGNYKNKSFHLSPGYNWEIVIDDQGLNCLVPTKK